MLPDIHLDQITFEEMMEEARNRIAAYYPAWTDFNYHDPGITLVELFAWMKEIQQYEMDHIGEEHRKRYLALLGERPRHRTGAVTWVHVDTTSPLRVAKGTRLQALDIPFEAAEESLLPGAAIISCFGFFEKKISYLDGEQLSLGQMPEFYPFGQRALPGTCLYIRFSEPLPVGEILRLTVRTGRQEGTPRNPAGGDAIPLARLSYTFWNGNGYHPLEIIRDETFGLLFDGQIVFRLPDEMKSRRVDQEEGWYLRVCLEDSQYDTPPVLSFLDVNTLRVCQKETTAAWVQASRDDSEDGILYVRHGLCMLGTVQIFACKDERFFPVETESCVWEEDRGRARVRLASGEEKKGETFWALISSGEDWYQKHFVLGSGLGFPSHSFVLDDEWMDYEDLEILVEEPEEPGVYRRWEKRESFSESGPEDRHYCADGRQGRLIFGDGRHGMAPEGRILLVSYSRVLGHEGNIKARKMQRFVWEGWEQIPVTNPWDALGGSREESTEDAFDRFRKKMETAKNMVSAADYEQAVRKTPGLRVESCRAMVGGRDPGGEFGREQVVQIAVRPCSLEDSPRPSPAFVQNIYRYLEPGRLLGVRLKIMPPVYIQVSVYLETTVYPQYQDAEALVRRAAEEYLAPFRTYFGGEISYSGLYGRLDRLDCVSEVRSLVLDAKGNGVRHNAYGDLLFPGAGIADRIEIQCSCLIQE